MSDTLDKESIVAMAIAAIAEELGVPVKQVRVLRFREVAKSPLAQYLEDNHITYQKFELNR